MTQIGQGREDNLALAATSDEALAAQASEMVRHNLVTLTGNPAKVTPAQLALSERLNDQQPRRIRERLQRAREPRCAIHIQGATNRLSGIKIEAQQLARLHRRSL